MSIWVSTVAEQSLVPEGIEELVTLLATQSARRIAHLHLSKRAILVIVRSQSEVQGKRHVAYQPLDKSFGIPTGDAQGQLGTPACELDFVSGYP